MRFYKVSQESFAVYAEDPQLGCEVYLGVFSEQERFQTNGLRVKHEGGDQYWSNLRKDATPPENSTNV